MAFTCHICSNTFVQKINLQRHLNERRCKSPLLTDLWKLNELLFEQQSKLKEYENIIEDKEERIKQLTINGNNNTVTNSNNDINMKIEININPITKLNVNYIEPEKMKALIESYDNGSSKNPDKLNLLLSDYIKDVICDEQHPENHAVKYTKKKPPTYNSITEDADGNPVTVIKGLKDTCELLSDPILNQLKSKMKEFVNKYKGDDDPNFDYSLYEDAINQLRKELNKDNVKKALSSVLRNDILNNIEMKLTCSVTEKKNIEKKSIKN
jgi:hypothetical protein